MNGKKSESRKRILTAAVLVTSILLGGTLGYRVLLGWNVVDSLYMTLTTVTTIGFGEIHEMDARGRVFTMCLIVFGVGSVLYVLSSGAQAILEGHLRNLFRRRRMERKVAGLSNHVIICGYGRMGKIVAEELLARRVPCVIVENGPELAKQIQEEGLSIIEGDATRDDVLKRAGIESARAIACVLDSDAKNLYITLSARELNPKILVLSRCVEESAEEKLRRAGANKLVFPYREGAKQIAATIVHPNVQEFMETILHRGDLRLEMREFTIPAGSFLDGVTLRQSRLREEYNLIVVGLRPAGIETMTFNPPTNSLLKGGDIMVGLGGAGQMDRLLSDLQGKG